MAKIGRNDPCPCLSGRKFKHCSLDTNRNNKSLLPSNVEEVHEALDLFGSKTPREASQSEGDRDQLTAPLKGLENAERRYALFGDSVVRVVVFHWREEPRSSVSCSIEWR